MTDESPEAPTDPAAAPDDAGGSPPAVVDRDVVEGDGGPRAVPDPEDDAEHGSGPARADGGPPGQAESGDTGDVEPDDTREGDGQVADSQPDDAEPEEPDWEARAREDPRSRAELLQQLADATDSRDEYLDALQRARAEFDNYRKRMMREGSAQREAGKADVAAALLDVLDDFDRTLDAADTSGDDGLAKGVQLVHGKLVDALRGLGLSRIDEADVAFDPSRHEAVQQREAGEDGQEPVVAEVLRPGYEMSGRVIRAAMVVVEQ